MAHWERFRSAARRVVLPFLILAAAALGPEPDAVPMFVQGGYKSQAAYDKWLSVWRGKYVASNGTVPEVPSENLPDCLRSSSTKVIFSEGGVASGVVSEGIGYALVVEGIQAFNGDSEGLANGLALARSWLGMVQGPGEVLQGGGDGTSASATQVDVWPYGVSAIEALGEESWLLPAGLPTWKYPVDLCEGKGGCHGSAADADSDAILGLIYLTAALKYPPDMVDVVIRSIIAFASADLGFPDLYRTMQDGTKIFVPKGGSDWGGVLPTDGKFHTSHVPWCYSPGYFAPSHYRMMRAFAVNNWRTTFNSYLPPTLEGVSTTVGMLTEAFDGAVVAGYNILYYSSCSSGATSNWVGVKSDCAKEGDLHCEGVPWASTPWVGESGTCTASGTTFGAYGAEASRTPWRIAMDFVIYPEWATQVTIYDRAGQVDMSANFNAKTYLNRFARQYMAHAQPVSDPRQLWGAFDVNHGAPDLTCAGVPKNGTANWWVALMSYPTFVGFVAPLDGSDATQAQKWMDALLGLCDLNKMTGCFCDQSYFMAAQEVISTMIMSGAVRKGGPPPPPPRSSSLALDVISDAEEDSLHRAAGATAGTSILRGPRSSDVEAAPSRRHALVALTAAALLVAPASALLAALRQRSAARYGRLDEGSRTSLEVEA
mmetsp:Transcript_12904/g.45752  ORF Transcript_12904/g.45752 Transcript_12904/m.45752 type:complete len:656 (-) Transcript_12904:162-2129(-)|eukprot:CAMPEP_0203867070 /NCGR_PEP_ID=MMETSP0359-20131031/16313_1 /ASSEMBLY_ACC=CAM_ASM_000338 /TAXON_ID=268821 /ORGANISM="Scrippsiella Hangoei, Strain SHTV-5" /LENGTH=655 /DNA_ID=CAMNT_0050785265 /DNA_START=97 /DNA_END=2064 /DNA_ORIENTATION=-